MPQGACRGYGTIRPATPTDCRYAESIHRICHRPAASRASKTHFSGLGPPWRSHPCIEGYPQCHRVRAVGMERSDRQHQPIADTQSRFTVYVTGLLHSRASKTHFSGLGPPWRSHPCIEGYPQCHRVRAVGMERSDRQHQPIADTQSRFTVYVTGLLHSRASKTHFSGLGPPWRSHPCIEGYPQCHRVRAVGMERSDRQHQPIADTQSRFTVYVTGLLPQSLQNAFFGSGAAMEVPSLY